MADENPPVSLSRGPTEGLALDNTVLRIDKGRVAPPSETGDEPRTPRTEHIPWGYGRDRITAMVVDPNRLYLFWELLDPTIEKARQALGAAGKEAWLSLRIYDITGRIFDGTNAHSYFDIKVDRSDRQWFVHIGKPTSTHVVEIGLKSYEGYFTKIARSGRAEFPRFDASPDGTVDWLTVRTATGPIGHPDRGTPPSTNSTGGEPGGPAAPPAPGGGGGGGGGAPQRQATWQSDVVGAMRLTDWSWAGWEELFHTPWIDGRRFLEWSTPMFRTSWEAGPFTLPIEPPTVSEEHFEGPVTVYALEDGRSRIVYGPWQVVIRGLGGRAEAHMVSRWEMEASWVVSVGFEQVVRELTPVGVRGAGPFAQGSSEALGASERRWLSASEMRLRGASELYMLGASELRMRGASEAVFGGGSERRTLGGSERLGWGGSEYRVGGGSEVGWLGSSEAFGGSETRLGSSDVYAGASEHDPGSYAASSGRSPFSIDEGTVVRHEERG